MNILAIDYGDKRMGLAWCQTELGVVLPYGKIKNEKPASPAGGSKIINHELINLLKKEKIDKVVVGLPLGLDGKENDNTKKVRKFVADLKKEIILPVELVDERFSSREADRSESGGASRDEKAAMIILENYLAKK